MNPFVNIKKFNTRLSSDNALELFKEFDIICDGTDNFPTRYLVNDACVLTGKPNVYGSIFRFEGQASIFATKNDPCYPCFHPERPTPGLVPSSAKGGAMGT
jgi:adenylyltransferase/sulfurtransferase